MIGRREESKRESVVERAKKFETRDAITSNVFFQAEQIDCEDGPRGFWQNRLRSASVKSNDETCETPVIVLDDISATSRKAKRKRSSTSVDNNQSLDLTGSASKRSALDRVEMPEPR